VRETSNQGKRRPIGGKAKCHRSAEHAKLNKILWFRKTRKIGPIQNLSRTMWREFATGGEEGIHRKTWTERQRKDVVRKSPVGS